MVDVTVDTQALTDLTTDVRAGLGRAGQRLATELPRIVREVFDAEGKRGDAPVWDRTTLVAFANRQTQAGKLAALVSNDYHNGQWKTGQDTGALRGSWGAEASVSGDVLEVVAEPAASYGPGFHAGGLATIDGRSVHVPPRMVSLAEADADLAESILLEAILG